MLTGVTTTLRQLLIDGAMSPKDRDFATSLLNARKPSARQEYWMAELVTRYTTPRPAQVEEQLTGAVAGIFQLFLTAQAKGLKFPKILLQGTAGQPVQFALAGERSKYAGQVMITDGRPFGSSRYYGRITQDGGLVASREMVESVRELVDAFAENPAYIASHYGKATGSCCFCRRNLETKESLAVGYGPVCADKFGLPWGELPQDTQAEEELAAIA
jgi:hypothetical protein